MMRLLCIVLFLFSTVQAGAAYADSATRLVLKHIERSEWDEAIRKADANDIKAFIPFIQWRQYRGIDERPTAEDILNFLYKHPHWPETTRLLDRAAEGIFLQGLHRNALHKWQELAKKHEHPQHHVKAPEALLRHYWKTGEFNASEQEKILSKYSKWLNGEDHLMRVDTLLWDERTERAKRLFPHISTDFKKLALARIALYSNQRGVNTAIRAVPKKLQNHPALIFERIRWRARKKLHEGVRELLLKAPEQVPYPEKWWPYRARQARDAIESKDYKLAYSFLKNHGQIDGSSLAEALWMRGWLQLEFLNDPQSAYKDFYKLYHNVSYPISLTRGAYWAATSAERNGNHEIAQNWYELAAKHSAHFYGQLAHLSLPKHGQLNIPHTRSDARGSSLRDTDRNLLIILQKLSEENEEYWVRYLFSQMAKEQKEPNEFIALANFAKSLGYPQISVSIGKKASQLQHYYLLDISHPMMELGELPIETALALAIIRQESSFNPRAESRAGAKGLMQLMPGTAKLVARQKGYKYGYSRLNDAEYNVALGSHYLASLIEQFNGSYPLAIAAYNAGPGNVKRWIERFGEPEDTLSGTLQWLELIPFHETRNYVQRVLENLQLYRIRLREKQPFTQQRAFGK